MLINTTTTTATSTADNAARRRMQVHLQHIYPIIMGDNNDNDEGRRMKSSNVTLSHNATAATAAVSNPSHPLFNVNVLSPEDRLKLFDQLHGSQFRFDPNKRYPLEITQGQDPSFDVRKMSDILRGDHLNREDMERITQIIDQPLFKAPHWNLSKEQARQLVAKQVSFLLQTGLFRIRDLKTEPYPLLNRLKVGGMMNSSVSVKLGVQLVLFSGSILNLGTKYHHDKYLGRAESMELPGCFAMTELTHGSNVRKLQTTATYDPRTREFVINTPDDGAVKWWLGNAQLNAVMATVFCRLIDASGTDHGIHAILVPVRDEKTHEAMPGVEIGDCGDKIGLHGIDNGWLRFRKVRVPRENLLNRFADVTPEGEYVSQFQSENRHFAAVLGELITGRLSLATSSMAIRKIAATIATRYACNRRQFAPPAAKKSGSDLMSEPQEYHVMDYRSHQVRLIPIIASCYAVEFGTRVMVDKFIRMHTSIISDDDLAEVHALTAGMKAVITWDTQGMLQTCRECCGGHGYSYYNRFGQLRNDHDIFLTFEGDNTVLVQQLGGYLLKQFSNQFKGNQITDAVRYLRRQIGVLVRDRNPVVTRLTSEKHLRSSEFHLSAFEHRTAKLLQECAMSFNRNKKRMGAFNAYVDIVPLIVRLARAYTEQFCLEQFVRHVEDTNDEELKNVLKMLCELYALDIMHNNIGDFLDVIKKNKAKAIENLREELCEDLREHALSLVDSFDLPSFVIDSPIGLPQGDYVNDTLGYAILRNPHNNSFPCDEKVMHKYRHLIPGSKFKPEQSTLYRDAQRDRAQREKQEEDEVLMNLH